MRTAALALLAATPFFAAAPAFGQQPAAPQPPPASQVPPAPPPQADPALDQGAPQSTPPEGSDVLRPLPRPGSTGYRCHHENVTS